MTKEQRRAKFQKLAERRVNVLLEDIRKLGNLSSRNNYDFTPGDINKIFSTIEDRLEKCKERFSVTEEEKEAPFKF